MKHFSELTQSAERIVDAAETLIRTVGYNGFSYEDIAKSVGIRKPSVHHHFSTKMELGVVVTQRYTHRLRETLLHIEGTMCNAGEQLRAYAQLFENTYLRDRDFCICGMLGAELGSLPAEINVEVQRFFQVNLEWLTATITRGMDSGCFHGRAPANERAEAFLSSMEGALLVGRVLPQAGGPLKVADVLITSFEH